MNDNQLTNIPDGLDQEQDFAEVVDLDGEPFEIIGDLEYEGDVYFALVPYVEDSELEAEDDQEEIEFIVLRKEDSEDGKDGECFLATVDDDDLFNKIGEMFLEMFSGE